MNKRIEGVTVSGIDIGKNTFHVVGLDSSGKPTLHSKFKRDRLLAHFANTPAALIGMESCPGSQWLARTQSRPIAAKARQSIASSFRRM
jgi:transposase